MGWNFFFQNFRWSCPKMTASNNFLLSGVGERERKSVIRSRNGMKRKKAAYHHGGNGIKCIPPRMCIMCMRVAAALASGTKFPAFIACLASDCRSRVHLSVAPKTKVTIQLNVFNFRDEYIFLASYLLIDRQRPTFSHVPFTCGQRPTLAFFLYDISSSARKLTFVISYLNFLHINFHENPVRSGKWAFYGHDHKLTAKVQCQINTKE